MKSTLNKELRIRDLDTKEDGLLTIAAGSIVPLICEDEKGNITDITICEAISGGADSVGGMPRTLSLTKIVNGSNGNVESIKAEYHIINNLVSANKDTEEVNEDTSPYKLTNRMIHDLYNNKIFCLMPSDFVGAFAKNVYGFDAREDLNRDKAIKDFKSFVEFQFFNPKIPTNFTYKAAANILNESRLMDIPSIADLNKGDNFIDVWALAHQTLYDMLRNCLTTQ